MHTAPHTDLPNSEEKIIITWHGAYNDSSHLAKQKVVVRFDLMLSTQQGEHNSAVIDTLK